MTDTPKTTKPPAPKPTTKPEPPADMPPEQDAFTEIDILTHRIADVEDAISHLMKRPDNPIPIDQLPAYIPPEVPLTVVHTMASLVAARKLPEACESSLPKLAKIAWKACDAVNAARPGDPPAEVADKTPVEEPE